ncbi:NLP/P60 family protein [hydrothermal vent metagenome]|uniref:NLP/P60 family protein n=1 Tax=hydrothermal vent metagenome TaxID=652676 RepID=A0A1W1BM59_9ZZZZ
MNLLKNTLFLVLAMQLLVLITLLTGYSLNKLTLINESFRIFNINEENFRKDITLAKIIQKREAIDGLVASIKDSIKDEKIDSFETSPSKFIYKAYVQNRYLPLSWDSDDINLTITKEIESDAKKFLGKRYVWAANGPDCFDCSGFTRYVYRQHGLNIPRHSGNQAEIGTKVEYDELKKGDLVFFDTERQKTGKVNHVGIYLEDGKFIHASSGNKKVVITNFNKKRYYKNHFLWGRRIVKDNIHYAFKSFSFDNINALVSTKSPIETSLDLKQLFSLDDVKKRLMASL